MVNRVTINMQLKRWENSNSNQSSNCSWFRFYLCIHSWTQFIRKFKDSIEKNYFENIDYAFLFHWTSDEFNFWISIIANNFLQNFVEWKLYTGKKLWRKFESLMQWIIANRKFLIVVSVFPRIVSKYNDITECKMNDFSWQLFLWKFTVNLLEEVRTNEMIYLTAFPQFNLINVNL